MLGDRAEVSAVAKFHVFSLSVFRMAGHELTVIFLLGSRQKINGVWSSLRMWIIKVAL